MSLYNCDICGELWSNHSTACKPKDFRLLAAPAGSVNPLSKMEQAQLDAVVVLLRRGEVELSRRILGQPSEDKTLVDDIRAYIEAHSPNTSIS